MQPEYTMALTIISEKNFDHKKQKTLKMNRFFITLLLIAIFFNSCCESKTEKSKEKSELGEFVYIDKTSCLHTQKICMNLFDCGDEGNQSKNYQVKFVEAKKLTSNDFNSICSTCVSDATFKDIRNILKQNGYSYEEEFGSPINTTAVDSLF